MEWNPTAISQLRSQLGITQAALAALVGASLNTVHRWEHGQSRPLPVYWRILDALKEKYDAEHSGRKGVS